MSDFKLPDDLSRRITSGKFPQVSGRTVDAVARPLGTSGKTYEKAKAVVAAAEADPEHFGDLPAKMDAKSTDAAHKEMIKRQAKLEAKKNGEARHRRGMSKEEYQAILAGELVRLRTKARLANEKGRRR